MNAQDFMWLAFGAAALIIAVSLAFVFARVNRVLDRTQTALGKVEQLLDASQAPLTQTLEHVGGVATNADIMIGRVNRLTLALEHAATAVAKAADAAQAAVSPTVANVVGVVAGISKGAQTFFRSRHGNGSSR
jgi:ABC-type transporter Mla subunit MlaD